MYMNVNIHMHLHLCCLPNMSTSISFNLMHQIKFLGPYLEVSRFRRLAQRADGAKLPRTRKLKEDLRGLVDSRLALK